jgi:hypothetical protein
MATKVGELGVRLETDFTLERLNTAVDVLVLFQSARCRKGLSAFSTSMTSSADMLGSYMALQVAWISEDFVAVFAAKLLQRVVSNL